MINTNEIRNGMTIEFEGNIYVVLEFQHMKTAKAGAIMQTKLRNLRTGTVIYKNFNGGISIDTATVEKSQYQYLYANGDMHVFMNNETYEQIELDKSRLEYELNFLTEGMVVNVMSYNEEILGLELPDKVVLEIVETAGAARGNTASNATKEALTNTGYRLLVPLFIDNGEKIVVSTATGKYDSRSK
ncbi:MAG: elongation factor P [Candidatus Izemoplasmatales bacterium]|nr:elongation factor P [Candidatus Izemoplasmatales bacterium]MDD4596110.1 elongation factor P [Candidatus Izemoplasmatales bacterium]